MKKLTLPQTLPLLPVLPALLLLAVLPVGLPAAASSQPAPTTSATDKLEAALKARDKGDLLGAKKAFEALLVSTPNNTEVQRLLADVNDKIAATPSLVAKVKEAEEKAAKAVADKVEKDKRDAEIAEQKRLNAIASVASKDAKAKATAGDFSAAASVLDAGMTQLGAAAGAKNLIASLQAEKADLPVQEIEYLLKSGDVKKAKENLAIYEKANPESPKTAMLIADIDHSELHPPVPAFKVASPDYINSQKEVARMVAKGRAQYNGGDYLGAKHTFDLVIGQDGINTEAHYFRQQIDKILLVTAREARETTAADMLLAVARGWELPSVFVQQKNGPVITGEDNTKMKKKLESISIPNVSINFPDIKSLEAFLQKTVFDNDSGASGTKGVNIFVKEDAKKPVAAFTLNIIAPVTAVKFLELLADKIHYEVVVNSDDVVLQPFESAGGVGMETQFIPISQPTLSRLKAAGKSSGGGGDSTESSDPFAGGSGAAASGDAGEIQAFLQGAGVGFPTGSNLTFDGQTIIVTNNLRNIERIRNLLGRYNDVKQVNIETKFLEVTQGNFTEMGINWNVARSNGRGTVTTPYRSLNTTFATAAGTSNAGVLVASPGTDSLGNALGPPITLPIINNPPTFPGVGDLAGEVTTNLLDISKVIGSFDINALVRALERKTGTELLSSPSLTVLSNNQASIAIAQELRYPRSYSDARVQTGGGGGGGGNNGGGGGGSVAIASGTPQDFDTRQIGVAMKVTPIVEDDDYNISLELSPTVTEFEGFVEYGGPNVAAVSGSTLSAPSGFFQPVFSVREISTKVEIWDGATLVMGGLTREQVRKLNDRTPILGDIPFIGRLFQSKGETAEKRNLIIFVTANLIGQGGALKKQRLNEIEPNARFEAPNVATPSGSESRRTPVMTK